jgi:hypothetical protein
VERKDTTLNDRFVAIYLGIGLVVSIVTLVGRHRSLKAPIPDEWSDWAVREAEWFRERQTHEPVWLTVLAFLVFFVPLWPMFLLLGGKKIVSAFRTAITGRIREPTRTVGLRPPPSYFQSSREIGREAPKPTFNLDPGQFVVCYDVPDESGLWGVMIASSKDAILAKYPELEVVDERPAWVTGDDIRRWRLSPYNLDDEPEGMLKAVVADRDRI